MSYRSIHTSRSSEKDSNPAQKATESRTLRRLSPAAIPEGLNANPETAKWMQQTWGNGATMAYFGARLQAKQQADAKADPVRQADPQKVQSNLGQGQALDEHMKPRMEASFRRDFSDVRVHTDARADNLSQGLHAKAFTIGGDIAFRSGQYRPGAKEGERLIAHELAHTVQQGATTPGVARKTCESSSDSLEQEADRAANAVVAGQQAMPQENSMRQISLEEDLGAPPEGVVYDEEAGICREETEEEAAARQSAEAEAPTQEAEEDAQPAQPVFVYVYSSDAFGVSGLNHAFVWSPDLQTGKGTNGSSWSDLGDGVNVEALKSAPYRRVTLPPGMTAQEFMSNINEAGGWNNWIWLPWINDCHTDLENAFEQAGVEYPGAPGGRVDIDDDISNAVSNFLSEAIRAIYQLYQIPYY